MWFEHRAAAWARAKEHNRTRRKGSKLSVFNRDKGAGLSSPSTLLPPNAPPNQNHKEGERSPDDLRSVHQRRSKKADDDYLNLRGSQLRSTEVVALSRVWRETKKPSVVLEGTPAVAHQQQFAQLGSFLPPTPTPPRPILPPIS
jgi:hypothetical protein